MRIGLRFSRQPTFPYSPQPVALGLIFILLSACNPTINDKKGEEYVAAQNAKKGAGAFADLTGQIANSQFPDGVVTSSKIDSAYTSTLATKTYADSYMLGYALPAISTFGSGDTIRWNTTTKGWEVFTPSAAAIAAGSITTTEIADGTVATIDLADSSVTSAKIADATIVNADIGAAAAIDGSKVNPAFVGQNISTTGTLAAGATTLSGALALGVNNLTSTGSATFASLTLSSTPLAVSSGGTGLATVGTANYVFASPNGATGAPAFRALVAADIPTLDGSKISSGTVPAAQMPQFTGGDVTTASTGSVSLAIGANKVLTGMIKDGEIVNADINTSAAIDVSKLAASGVAGETRFLASVSNAAPVFTDTSVFVKNSKVFSNNIIRDQYRNLLIKMNAGTPTTQIDVSADEVTLQDGSGVGVRLNSVSFTIDGTATGANGFSTGADGTITASTWYYIWIIYDSTNNTTAGLLSTSSTAPTLPGVYTYKGLFGAIYNTGAGPAAFTALYQQNKRVITKTPAFSTGVLTPAQSGADGVQTVNLADAVPPNAKWVLMRGQQCGSTYIEYYGDSSENYAQSSRTFGGSSIGCWQGGVSFLVPLMTAQTTYYKIYAYDGTANERRVVIEALGWEY